MGITLEQVGVAVAFLVGLVTGIGFLMTKIKGWIQATMKEPLDRIREELRDVNARIDEVDMDACKNFLVSFLADVEKGSPIDEIQLERFYEQYRHYQKNGGNSYIKHKVDKLQGLGKI